MARERIPFTLVHGDLIQVEVTLPGPVTVPMLVDLGAGMNVLSSGTARQIGFKATSMAHDFDPSGHRFDIPTGVVASVSVGPLVLPAPTFAVWSELDQFGVAGLISATAFRNAAVTFDFQRHELVVEDPRSLGERIRTSVRVPIELLDDRDVRLTPFARFDFGKANALCEIDTGTDAIFIDRTFAAESGMKLDVTDGAEVASASGPWQRAVVVSLALQGDASTQELAAHVGVKDLAFDCVVGNAFWSAGVFTLDFPNRALYVNVAN